MTPNKLLNSFQNEVIYVSPFLLKKKYKHKKNYQFTSRYAILVNTILCELISLCIIVLGFLAVLALEDAELLLNSKLPCEVLVEGESFVLSDVDF